MSGIAFESLKLCDVFLLGVTHDLLFDDHCHLFANIQSSHSLESSLYVFGWMLS